MQHRLLWPLLLASLLAESCKTPGGKKKNNDPYVPEDINLSAPPDSTAQMAETVQERPGALQLANPTPAQYRTYGYFGPQFNFSVIPIHVILMPNGKVLYFGTDQNGNQTAQYNYGVWDPALGFGANAHQLLPNNFNTDIFCSATEILPETGNVLIASGDTRNPPNFGIKDVFIYNKDAQNLTRTANLNYARWYPTLTTLPNGEALIYGGRDGGGAPIVPPEIYANGNWRTVMGAANGAIINNDEGKWFYPRNWVAPDGRVFGTTGNVMYYLDLNGAGSANIVGYVPNKTRSNTSAAVMFAPGKILQLGGSTNGDTQARGSNQAILIDINSGNPQVTNLPNMNFARHWAGTTVLPNGEVFVSGGSAYENKAQELAYTAEMYNPANNTFRPLADARLMRLYHANSLLLPDATVLTAGGGAPGPQVNLNGEIYFPPYLFDAAGNRAPRLAIGAVAATQTYGATLNFPVTGTGAGTATRVTLVRAGSVTHSVDMGQRFLELGFTKNGGNVSAVLPTSPNLAPPGTYMLFVLNEAGVPSVAKLFTLKGAAVTPPGPAVNTVYQLAARHSTKCATVEGGSAATGANLKQVTCDGRAAQKFRVEAAAGGDFQLKNTTSNKCISVNPANATNGTLVQQLDCNGAANQKVKFLASTNGSFTVRFNNSAKCMDVSEVSLNENQQIHQWDCVNGANQDWLFQTPVGGNPNPNPNPTPTFQLNTPYTVVARHSGKCLDIDNNSAANGTKVWQYACNGSAAQIFKIVAAAGGDYHIVNVGNNKCVDVSDVALVNGQKIHQWDCLNGQNQIVKLTPSANGSFTVKFNHSGKCMEVPGSTLADATQTQQWDCNNAANQDWSFVVPAAPLPAPPAGVTLGNAYRLQARHSNKCAQIAANPGANGTAIVQFACGTGNNQKFKIVRATNGQFNLVNMASNKCVEVAGGALPNGTAVQQADCANTPRQAVKFVAATVAGYYSLRFTHSEKCFDVSEVSAADNQKIHQWDCVNGANQEWKVMP